MKIYIKLFLIVVLCTSLSACGFHLRGREALPPQLKTLYVDAAPYSPLTLSLKQTLKSAGVNVVDSAKESPLTLQILSENFNQQLINISANTFVKSYKLTYIVQFQLVNKSQTVIYGPVSVQDISSFVSSDTQILGSNADLDNQEKSLRREAIGLIFNRLGSQDVRKALMKR